MTKMDWGRVRPGFVVVAVGLLVGLLQPFLYIGMFLFSGTIDTLGPLPVWARAAWAILGFPLMDLSAALNPEGKGGPWAFVTAVVGDAIIWGVVAGVISSQAAVRRRRQSAGMR